MLWAALRSPCERNFIIYMDHRKLPFIIRQYPSRRMLQCVGGILEYEQRTAE